nr:exosome complex component RRP4 homolog [Ipomoea batatas]GMD04838.1 exosome complex component RRP4 homolog [Ipomoea batatas]
MRGLQISLNKTQKIRLERALELLESFSSKTNSNASVTVTVADVIPVDHEDGVLKGHGTAEMDGRVVATLCGVVERVNKLVYVRSLRARYKPEVGDIIVGRVIEVIGHFPLESILTCLLYWVIGAIVNAKVDPKRWRLEINSSQDAVLMLSCMNLPDGIQAEVRGFQHDGSLHLQARSQKYGKVCLWKLIALNKL